METNQTAPGAGPVPEDAQGDSASAGPQAEGAVGSSSASSAGSAGGSTAGGATADASGPGFYAWLRRLGVPRRAGWLGGVCAGVGARLGIDPIIVRGIVVVIAVLGAPFVLLYAIAWLLLPDTDGQIQLERLTRGIVDPAIVGIAVMGVIGLIPLVQGGWLGWRWWPDWSISDPLFGFDLTWPLRILWALIVVGAIIALVVWLARRAAAGSPGTAGGPGAAGSPAAAGTPPYGATDASTASSATTLAFAAGGAGPATATAPAAASAGPVPATEPPVPAQGADADAIAEWRAQHEAWRVSHAEWKAGQAEADREARARAAEENKARAQELAAQAEAARAARRASRPRTSAAYVVTVLGVALIGGAIAALRALGVPETAGFAIPIALAVATLAIAVGMLLAALRRRRAGFLAFTAIVSTVAMVTATAGASIMPQGALVPPGYGISLDHSQRLVQPFGDAYMFALPTGGVDTPVIELTQGTGDTWLTIDENASVVLYAADAGDVRVYTVGPDGMVSQVPIDPDDEVLTLGGDPLVIDRAESDADVHLVLSQGTGDVHIEIHEGE
ncbi:PspC domain-containing protein [Agromyces sp. SYSU K20354]|uniref:PspC domain-containing protein n=1 Tax=Agromyces cavernae TaxID=2898659 RepID=UPI001E5A85F9|nr:PspC domain-containing protein [Agromyces cavernae]MCD2443336.1 PspC domain-containing protein [Agromyces cavernae]